MEGLMVIALALAATWLPLAMGRRYGLLPLVSPMHLLGYFCALGFLVKVVVYRFVPDWAFYSRYIDTPEAALAGALYLGLFVLLICLGYRLAIAGAAPVAGRGAARLLAQGITRRGALFALAFAVAALTFAAILRARGLGHISAEVLATLNADKQINVGADGVGATLAGIKTFFVVPKCAFVLLLAHGLAARNPVSLAQAGVLALLVAVIGLVSGDRFELVELLAYGGITYLIIDGRVRPVAVLLAVAAAGAVLALSAYMTALRGSGAGLLQQIVGSTYFLDINAAVMITDRHHAGAYLWGQSYGWWSFGWVPRAVWPDKPAIDLGVFFKREVMGLTTGGAFNVTGPGEAYINFGWLGLLVAPVLGGAFRLIEVALLDPARVLRRASFVYYPLLFYPFVQAVLQSSFSAFIVGAAAQVVLLVAMAAIFMPRYRPAPSLDPAGRMIGHAV